MAGPWLAVPGATATPLIFPNNFGAGVIKIVLGLGRAYVWPVQFFGIYRD